MTYPVNTPEPEDPFSWYGLSPALPVVFTGAWQTRQVGVGDCQTLGAGSHAATALSTVPTKLTSALTRSASRALALYRVTPSDQTNY